MRLLRARHYTVVNTDLTVIAQAPKLAAYREAMRAVIAQDLRVTANDVNIKATTTEQMGFTGRKEGIAALAVVLIKYDPPAI